MFGELAPRLAPTISLIVLDVFEERRQSAWRHPLAFQGMTWLYTSNVIETLACPEGVFTRDFWMNASCQ